MRVWVRVRACVFVGMYVYNVYNKKYEGRPLLYVAIIYTIYPEFKGKGDVLECNNYRGIKLMSYTMKLWERMIERDNQDCR